MHSPGTLVQSYRSQGRKLTPQRLAVFDALYGDTTHPSAETIHDRVCATMPSVSLRTVYQVLNDLVEMSEVETVSIGGGPVRFDPNTEDHQHFVCSACGSVHDVQAESPASLSRSAHRGFEVQGVATVFHGLCPRCVDGGSQVSG